LLDKSEGFIKLALFNQQRTADINVEGTGSLAGGDYRKAFFLSTDTVRF
jgi:hypothetical protein